jgi:hypothetical protein
MATLQQWVQDHQGLVWIMGIASVFMFLGTFIVLVVIIVKLPSQYFLERRDGHVIGPENRVSRAFYLALKNLVGLLFILAGLAMLVLPGQGLLSLLIGLSLTNFPGKRRVIRLLIRRKAILKSANWIRKKFDRPPLQAPG